MIEQITKSEANSIMKIPVDTLFIKMDAVNKKVKKNKYKEMNEIYSSKPYAKFNDLGNDKRVTKEYMSELNYIKTIVDWNNYYMMYNGININNKSDEVLNELFNDVLKKISFEDMIKNYAGLDASKFGTGFIYLFTNESGKLMMTWLSPLSTYVQYKYSTREPIYGFRYWQEEDLIKPTKMNNFIEYCDDKYVITLKRDYSNNITCECYEHIFGVVPIIECMNNKDRDGEIAGQLKANQLINMLLSKYNEKLGRVSAETQVFDNIEFSNAEAKKLFDEKGILMVKPGMDANGKPASGSVSYVQNDIPTGFIETVTYIRDSMFDTSCTPNFAKEEFYGSVSGIALKLKMTPSNIKSDARKELFKTSIYRILECVKNYLMTVDYSQENPALNSLDVRDFDVEFNNMQFDDVVDKMTMLEFMNNSGAYSKETIVGTVGISSADVELERKNNEAAKEADTYSLSDKDGDLNEVNTDTNK